MRFFLASLLLAATSCMPNHGSQTPHTYRAADLESKTVALVRANEREAMAYCSGVWVADNAILTADHCTHDADVGDKFIYVTRGDLDAVSDDEPAAIRIGELADRDADHDLALIRVKLPPAHSTAFVSPQEPYVGESTHTMGHPIGLFWSYSTGVVSAVRHAEFIDAAKYSMWWVQTTAPISPGNSGGGLFDDQGELIGLCHGHIIEGNDLNLYVHSGYIKAFLVRSL